MREEEGMGGRKMARGEYCFMLDVAELFQTKAIL
jgi:hypothetical protein